MRFNRLVMPVLVLIVAQTTVAAIRPAEPPPAPPAHKPSTGREVDLRPKFQSGRETRYQLDLSSANQLKSDPTPDLDGDQTLTQSIGLRIKTVEVGDDGATVEITYDTIKATLETKDFRAEFDSAGAGSATSTSKPPAPAGTRPTSTRPRNPSGAPAKKGAATPAKSVTDREMDETLADLMRPMVGTKLTLKVDPSGNIKSVSGGDALGGGGLSALLGDALKGLGGGGAGIGGAGLTPTPGSGGGPLNWIISGPAQRGVVRVGESWTNNDTLTGTPIGGLAMVTKHTCRSVSGDKAHCVFTGHADAASSGHANSGAGGNGFQLNESSYDGTYDWDTSRGELSQLTCTLNTRVGQGGTAGQESPTRLSAKTKVTVRRLK